MIQAQASVTCNISVLYLYFMELAGHPLKKARMITNLMALEKNHLPFSLKVTKLMKAIISLMDVSKSNQMFVQISNKTKSIQSEDLEPINRLHWRVIAQCTYIVLSRTIFVVISASPSSTMTMVCLQACF